MRLPHPLYGLYERRLAASLPTGRTAAARRRHPRRQPPLGAQRRRVDRGTGTRRARTRSPTCSSGARTSASRSSRCGCCPPTTSREPPTSSSRCSRSSRTRSATLAATGRWRIQAVGALELLPDHTVKALVAAQDATADVVGLHVNVAVGYGGRTEIADAVKSFLREHADAGSSLDELAEAFDVEHIAEHLYTKGQPDPELVIRTSGEQRLGGFLLWQSAHSEFYFCEAYWPDFRRVDFLRAVRAYAARERRGGR